MIVNDRGAMKKLLTALMTAAMTFSLYMPPTHALADDGNLLDDAASYGLEGGGEELGIESADEPIYDTDPIIEVVDPEPQQLSLMSSLSPQDVELQGTSTIKVDIGFVDPDANRTSAQYPAGKSYGWLSLPYYSRGAVDIIDANGVTVASITGQARPEITNLPAGTYTIRLTNLDTKNEQGESIYAIVAAVVNGGPISNLLTEYETEVTVEEGQTITYYAVVEYRAFGFKTTTDVGTFANGTQEKVYYEGWNGQFDNTDPSRKGTNPIFSTHNGIYYGDSMSQYNANKLEEPVLSEDEAAKGYKFLGWQLEGDESGRVFTTTEALNHVVRTHTTFKAAWEYPTHTVTFATNTDYGTIGGNGYYSYQMDFDDQKVSEIPAVEEKEGYEFIGWFTDHTTNVVPEAEILNTTVDRDLNYFAKYREKKTEAGAAKYNVQYLPGDHGTLSGRTMLLIPAGGNVPTVPTVTVNDGLTFVDKWKVVDVTEGNGILEKDDELTEIQLSRLQVNFDLILEAVYEHNFYTVIYMDGAGHILFDPHTHEELAHGSETPVFTGSLERDGHEFVGWDKPIEQYVTSDMVYTAQWRELDAESTDEPVTETDPTKEDPAGEQKTDEPASKTEAPTQTATATTTTTKNTTETEKPADTKDDSATDEAKGEAKDDGAAGTDATAGTNGTTGTTTTTRTVYTTSAGDTSRSSLAKTGDNAASFAPFAVAGLAVCALAAFARRNKNRA